MTKEDQIKELAEVIKKDYPEVNAEHIAKIAVEWFNKPPDLYMRLSDDYIEWAENDLPYLKESIKKMILGLDEEKKTANE